MLKHLQEWAVIRLATLQNKRGERGRLLFASVTVLEKDRPLPPPMKGVESFALNKQGGKLFFRRTVLNKDQAIDWYRSLGNGEEKTPIPSYTADAVSGDGVPISVSKLIDDPTWPSLGLPIGDDLFSTPPEYAHPAPFAGTTAARLHRRFGDREGFDHVLENNDAINFLKKRIHIDLLNHREYLGSIAYVAPDPIIKKIDCFMIPANGELGERIFYRFIPRSGKTVEDLTLTTFDIKGYLLTSFEPRAIPSDGILDIQKRDCSGTYGFVITHPQYGLLTYSQPTGFLREINITSHPVLGPKTIVRAPMSNAPDAEIIEYAAAQSISPLSWNTSVGEVHSDENIHTRIAQGASRREKLANATQYGQRWFSNGSREEAMRFIHRQLNTAKKRIMIADPYLGPLQFGQFLYAVSGQDIEVILLTSKYAFNPTEGSEKTKINLINDFEEQLKNLEQHQGIKVFAFVLPQSLLHDRFMVIDQTVWFLGNSLNALGDKASMIVKIPNPDEVINQLNSMRLDPNTKTFELYKQEQSRT